MFAFLILGVTAAPFALQPEAANARSTQRKISHSKHHAVPHWSRRTLAKRRAAAKSDRRRHVTITIIPEAPPAPPPTVLTRAEILASDPARLERLGQRLVVGFENFATAKALVEKQAIAGIFITDHNVQGRPSSAVAKDIRSLQDIRRSQGLPRLIVAADQEGGYVSRLSPPLKRQPALGALIAPLKTDVDREKAVRAYAETQARELDRLGITMNFGPVVDLRLDSPKRDDGETRIYWRAIASDPFLVARVAGWYCDTLSEFNIICTLKHFPGLGRVMRDTHVAPGQIVAAMSKLELSDWVPFRRVMIQPGVATMIGHVRIAAIDNATPASYSDAVVNAVRTRWEARDSLLITDDFSMGAVTDSKDGVGSAAVRALNAGVDLVLLRDSEKHFDTVMSALIEADSHGDIDKKRESESHDRLSHYVFIDDREPPIQAQQ
jgi:beta-N-acetylhexosaminidase